MQSQQISLQQFVEKLQSVVGQPIWRVIHPADGWLSMDLGKEYQDFISDKDGSEKPYVKGEYQLQFKGDWIITRNEKMIGVRAVQPDEKQENYFDRMEKLANSFPIKAFSHVSISGNQIVFEAEDDYQLKVTVTGSDDALSLTAVALDGDSKPVAYTHYRFDKDLGSLAEVSAR